MENIFEEYSKFLDETKSHLSQQTLATYINLQDQLSDKEKQFISNHLAECKECTKSFNTIFDEDLDFDGKKNVISLFRQQDNQDEETVLFRSGDSLVEIEITRLSQTDFNLRFLSLPSRLKKERAALKVNSEYILNVLSMDLGTVYIIHSENDIMNLDSFELISLTAPPVIPVIPKKEEPQRSRKFYWYAAAAIVVFASVIFIYYSSRTGIGLQSQNEPTQVITDLTPGQKPIRESDTASVKVPEADKKTPENENTKIKQDLFAANVTLENFVNRNNRSDSRVEIVSPSIGAEVRMPVRFEWLTVNKNITLKFVILSNQNLPVYEKLINGKELTIDTKLDPGLYYWKLESQDNIESMGKFIIR